MRLVDAHVHAFPPQVKAAPERFFSGEPAFGWLYDSPGAKLVTAEELIQALDEMGVAQAVTCSFPWRSVELARDHNDYLLAAARSFPGRILPLAAVDPSAAGALQEAERAISRGAAGLGEIGAYFADLGDETVREGLISLGRLAAEADKPVLLHTNEPIGRPYPGKSPMSLAGLYGLIQACPRTRFQLAHLGGGIFIYEWLKKEVRETLALCAYDTAAAPYLFQPSIYRVLKDIAAEGRLLWGSDFPLLGAQRYLKDLDQARLPLTLRRRILSRNARNFWRLFSD